MSTLEEKEIRGKLERLESLIQDIERLPDPGARDHAKGLVQALLEFHGMAIGRLLDRIADADESGAAIIGMAADDEAVSSLLLLYGLHPRDLNSRVHIALEKVRPYLKSHGGGVELLGVDPAGVVHLRMEGSCQGCPSSSVTLKNAIEEAILKAAPDVTAIRVEGVVDPSATPAPHLVPLELGPAHP